MFLRGACVDVGGAVSIGIIVDMEQRWCCSWLCDVYMHIRLYIWFVITVLSLFYLHIVTNASKYVYSSILVNHCFNLQPT